MVLAAYAIHIYFSIDEFNFSDWFLFNVLHFSINFLKNAHIFIKEDKIQFKREFNFIYFTYRLSVNLYDC